MTAIRLRFAIAILGSYACSLVYMHRSGISVAVVAMTKKPENHIISSLSFANSTEQNLKPEFEWSETLQGVILGAQFYLYIFVPTLAGRATDAIGGKWIAFFGALGPFILAMLTPVMTELGGAWALIINRILVGGFHGVTYAAMFSLYVKWFPIQELSTANSGLIFGGSIGSTIMSALAGYIAQYWSWQAVFYVIALFHLPFLILWFIFSTNEPNTNRFLSNEERVYIQQNVQEKVISKKIKAPWLKMIFSVPVICSLITKMCSGFGYFLMITKMPAYLENVFSIELFKNGWVYAGTNLANGLASLLAPTIANLLINRLKIRRLIVRKIFQSIALFGPALCLGLIPAFGTQPNPVIAMLIMAMMLYGFFSAGEWTIISEYAPNFAGTVFGMANILAFAMGVVAPYIVGVLLDDKNSGGDRQQWNKVFYISVIIYVIGGLTFLIFATDQQQSWDRDAIVAVMDDYDEEKSRIRHHNDKQNKFSIHNNNSDDLEDKTSTSTTS
ncbi:sialin-like protein 6 [Dermatophagoides farinae]|uniref:Sialin-like protein 6 n=1 Tax=Dermatophagoides farinae TaxID=6954 RepID=A0A9D4NWP9_DERFA|nr:sialin-like protein 6 [Dermatophagoides farinae]